MFIFVATKSIMRGIVFTSFLEKLESNYGYEFVDDILNHAELPSGGAYTAVGKYNFSEFVSILSLISSKTNISIDTLLYDFGKHFFFILMSAHKHRIEMADKVLPFLASIQNHIHIEVKKLYPDAELPEFSSNYLSDKQLELEYSSKKRLFQFAKGLIESSLEYYETQGTVEITAIKDDTAIFLITIQ